MSAGATSPCTWRLVFGNTEEWAQPECSRPCLQAGAEGPVTWRVIFGNTSAWLPPQLENPTTPALNALAEICELCRLPISQGEDFVTNSAGQQPAHTRCLDLESSAAAEQGPAPRRWLSMLRDLWKR